MQIIQDNYEAKLHALERHLSEYLLLDLEEQENLTNQSLQEQQFERLRTLASLYCGAGESDQSSSEMDEDLHALLAQLPLYILYQQQKLKMSMPRYKSLMEEISVIYYDELSHEIITGHKNGSICIWN